MTDRPTIVLAAEPLRCYLMERIRAERLLSQKSDMLSALNRQAKISVYLKVRADLLAIPYEAPDDAPLPDRDRGRWEASFTGTGSISAAAAASLSRVLTPSPPFLRIELPLDSMTILTPEKGTADAAPVRPFLTPRLKPCVKENLTRFRNWLASTRSSLRRLSRRNRPR